MMRRVLVLATAVLLTTGLAAAQQPSDVGPGMIGASSPVYGLEAAWDNAAVTIGLKQAGTVAQERAAEAKQAAENGDAEGAERAAEAMNSIAQKATADDTEGLSKARAVLQEAMAQAPSEARQGLQTALDNVRREEQRTQQEQQREQGPSQDGQQEQGENPSSGPDTAPDGDNGQQGFP